MKLCFTKSRDLYLPEQWFIATQYIIKAEQNYYASRFPSKTRKSTITCHFSLYNFHCREATLQLPSRKPLGEFKVSCLHLRVELL